MMKHIYIITFSIFIFCFNSIAQKSIRRPIGARGNGKTSRRVLDAIEHRKLETFFSAREYDFEGCSKFNKEDDKNLYNYFVTCEDGTFAKDENIEELYSASKRIKRNIYENHLLDDISEFTKTKLQNRLNELIQIKECLKSKDDSSCLLKKEQLVDNTIEELKEMRFNLALSSKPPKNKEFNEELSHSFDSIFSDDLPPLSEKEKEEVRDEYLDQSFRIHQEWLAQKSSGNPNCIKKLSPGIYTTNKDNLCSIINAYEKMGPENKLNNETREKYKTRYEDIVTNNPLLSHINLRGDEPRDEIFKQIYSALEKLTSATHKSLINVRKLKGSERAALLQNDLIVDQYINESGANEIKCDVLQSLKTDVDNSDMLYELSVAAGTLTAGAACIPLGLVCGLVVAIGGEAIAIKHIEQKYDHAKLSLNSGLKSSESVSDTNDERNIALIAAPLAALGIERSANIARKNPLYQELKQLTQRALRKKDPNYDLSSDIKGVRKKSEFRKKTEDIKAPKNKEELKKRYLNKELVDETLNQRWIDNAKANSADMYFDVDNSAMKRLNDNLGDKDLVTALTNMHKDILSSKINKLLEKYPNVDIEIYSDFKSVRYAFTAKPASSKIPPEFNELLDKAYKEANSEYANMVKALDAIPDSESPKGWFQAGTGETADQAGSALKMARRINKEIKLPGMIATKDLPGIIDFKQAQKLVKRDLEDINSIAQGFKNPSHPLNKAGLTEEIEGTNTLTLNTSLFEIVRKVPKPSEDNVIATMKKYETKPGSNMNYEQAEYYLKVKNIQKQIKEKHGVELDESQAQQVLNYGENLDSLTPGLWTAKREFASLDKASHGGMSGDVTGMGAQNMKQVAKDLANSNNTTDPREALVAIREGEEKITGVFKDVKKDFEQTVERILRERKIPFQTKCSGDDCVVIPEKELSLDDHRAMMKAFTQKDNPSQFRMSFIPRDVPSNARSQLAVNGELVEKELRKLLTGVGQGKITKERLDQITMGTRMPKEWSDGAIDLLYTSPTDISKEERELINKQFKEAVKLVNDKLNKDAAKEGKEEIYQYQTVDPTQF